MGIIYGQFNFCPNVTFEHDINVNTRRSTNKIYSMGSYFDDYFRIEYTPNCLVSNDTNERYVIVMNGCIYNISEIRNNLIKRGKDIKDGTDSTVLLNLFVLKGENIVHDLRGMFTLIIWDKEKKNLFIARDSFGIKSIYYKNSAHGIVFSSNQQNLLQNDSNTLLAKSIQDYLTLQYVPDNGLIKGVQLLKPGHLLTGKLGGKIRTYEYTHLNFQPSTRKTLDSTIKHIREALEESVYMQTKDDISIGAYLSGGVDSTSIVALAKQHKADLLTFTVGFKREGYNECDLAKETAHELGLENFQKIITPEEVIQELPNIIFHMDNPISDPAAIPNYFLAKEATKQVDVVLSGEGADELFGGYKIYLESQSLKIFNYMPNTLKCGLNKLSQILPEGMKGKSFLWRGTTPLSQRYTGNAHIFNEAKKRRILQNYQDEYPFTKVTEPLFEKVSHLDSPTQMQYIDLHTWLNGDVLAVADRMTNAYSLEMRLPFLDKKVFDVARTIPSNMKLSHGTTKYVLREAMKDLIPNAVTYREKLGFPVPIRHWLRNELYDWAKNTINTSPLDDIFHKHEVQKLLEAHLQKKYDYSRELWTILTFMVWYDLHMNTAHHDVRCQSIS